MNKHEDLFRAVYPSASIERQRTNGPFGHTYYLVRRERRATMYAGEGKTKAEAWRNAAESLMTIPQLYKRVRTLHEALKPFAAMRFDESQGSVYRESEPDMVVMVVYKDGKETDTRVTVGDFLRAREVNKTF